MCSFSSVIAIDRSIDRKEEGSAGAQEEPPGDGANEMRSIANARRPGAGDEALCSSWCVCVCVCVSLLVNLYYQSFFFFGTRVRLIAWTPGSRAQGGVCDWIGHHATALIVCCHVTKKTFLSFFPFFYCFFVYVTKISYDTIM